MSLEQLDRARGSGTSLVSWAIPNRYPISKANAFITQELGTANNIKCRVNRASVQSALRHIAAKLKLYKSVPSTGLLFFSGQWV